MKLKGKKDENGEPQIIRISVYDYFVHIRKIPLSYSADLPCIDVGKPDRPTYIPLEVNLFPSLLFTISVYMNF